MVKLRDKQDQQFNIRQKLNSHSFHQDTYPRPLKTNYNKCWMFIPIDYQLSITNILYITLYIYFFYCLYVNITLKYLKNIFKKMCNLIQYRMIETSVDFYSSSTPPHPQLLQFWFLSDIDLLILPLSCIWVLSQNTVTEIFETKHISWLWCRK